MKSKYIKIISTLIVGFIVLITAIYIDISSAQVSTRDDISWIKETPIAHRGLHDNSHVENSISAFKNAIDNDYAIELDVQLTKDNQVIVFHDENLKRMTNDNRDVSDINYNELKNLKLKNSHESIPLLKEVLEVVDGKTPILIEIKNGDDVIRLGKELYNIVKCYNGKYAVQSFNPFVLEWYKNNAPEVLRGQLSGTFTGDSSGNLKVYEKFALENLMLNFKSKPNFIAYELKGLPHFRVSLLRKHNIPILSWTVESEKELDKAYKYSDNIIFDKIRP